MSMFEELFDTDNMPKGYLFDMDHTLINNDCDVSWKTFLVNKGLAPSNALDIADYYYQQYRRGELDINEFLKFQLAEFKGRTPAEMDALAQEHFETLVRPT